MSFQSQLLCSTHEREVVGKCCQCDEWVCLQCSFIHKQNDHEVIKLQSMVQQWMSKLKQWIKGLQQQLGKHKNDLQQNKVQKGIQIIQLCKDEVIQLIDHHFQELKEQYIGILQASYQTSPQKQLSGFVKTKLSEYSSILSKLKLSAEVVFSLQENIGNEYELVVQFIQQKQKQCQQHLKNQLQLLFNQQSLLHIGDLLTQMIGVSANKITKQSLDELEGSKYKEHLIVSFLEQTSQLYLYDTLETKASKIHFADFLIPSKAGSCVTPSGKILLIGGESEVENKTKYNKQIWQFDKKYNMMKILTLMKTARSFHSVTLANYKNQEYVYILGGRNTQRLSTFQRYNISTNTITNLKQYDQPLAGQTGIQIQDMIYYFGGKIGDTYNDKILVYSISKDEWKQFYPVNPINYIPTVQPVIYKANNYIVLLGGWRKSAKTGYVTNYIQYYSPELNIIQVGKGLLPTGIFRQLSINYQSGVYNICCETKRDSTSFGPNLPHILTVDLIKNRFQINNFMQC